MALIDMATVYLPSKGWQTIQFLNSFESKPVLIAFAQNRTGVISPPIYDFPQYQIEPITLNTTIPTIQLPPPQQIQPVVIPTITIPTITIGRVGREDFTVTLESWYETQAINFLGNWGIFQWMRDILVQVIGAVGWIQGHFMNWLWDSMLQPQINYIQSSIQNAMTGLKTSLQSTLDTMKNEINQKVNTTIMNTNAAVTALSNTLNDNFIKITTILKTLVIQLNTLFTLLIDNINNSSKKLTNTAEKAVNDSMKMLYELIGLGSNLVMTPCQTQNLNTNSFEIYGLGDMNFSYIAFDTRIDSILQKLNPETTLIDKFKEWIS